MARRETAMASKKAERRKRIATEVLAALVGGSREFDDRYVVTAANAAEELDRRAEEKKPAERRRVSLSEMQGEAGR